MALKCEKRIFFSNLLERRKILNLLLRRGEKKKIFLFLKWIHQGKSSSLLTYLSLSSQSHRRRWSAWKFPQNTFCLEKGKSFVTENRRHPSMVDRKNRIGEKSSQRVVRHFLSALMPRSPGCTKQTMCIDESLVSERWFIRLFAAIEQLSGEQSRSSPTVFPSRMFAEKSLLRFPGSLSCHDCLQKANTQNWAAINFRHSRLRRLSSLATQY